MQIREQWKAGARALLCVALSLIAACETHEAEKQAPATEPGPLLGPTPWQACACPAKDAVANEVTAELTHGPVLGAVTDHSIKVWTRGTKNGKFVVRLAPQAAPADERCSAPVAFVKAQDRTAVAFLEGLSAATTYTYRVEVLDSDDACGVVVGEAASFRTLPKAGSPTRVRFAVGADVRGADVPGFADIASVKPDFVLMIGDNVYADDDGHVKGDYAATFKRYQRLYQRVWGGAQFRALFSSTPVFMIWDDHEIMENYWAGKDDIRYGVSRSLFDSYQGNHNPDPIDPGELYFSFNAGDIGFFLLDVRTHRDGNELKERLDPSKTMLGRAQREALLRWLASDRSRVHVVVSPVILSTFRTTGADSWRAFDAERQAVLDAIAANGASTTFVISGDQHWSAVLRIDLKEPAPYTLYEFQTTPLASGTRPAPENPDDRLLALDNTHRVFGVFDIDTISDPPAVDFTMCAVGKPCAPQAEPAPMSVDVHTAKLPYSVHFKAEKSGLALQPAAVCQPGADQTCNDDPAISSLHGTCQPNGTCECKAGIAKNPQTGRCP